MFACPPLVIPKILFLQDWLQSRVLHQHFPPHPNHAILCMYILFMVVAGVCANAIYSSVIRYKDMLILISLEN